MALENKLGLTSSADLAREEERISKKKAVWLFESGTLDKLPVGTFASLKAIHGESGKRKLPLCAAHVSGSGAGEHRENAAEYV